MAIEPPGALLATFTRRLAQTTPGAPLSLRLCMAFSDILAADGGAITMGFAAPERITLCATDPASARAEDAQELLREGPSLDAYRTGTAVSGLSLGEQRERWPMLAEMLDASARPVIYHAFPISPEAAVLGVVLVHQDHDRGIAVTGEEAQFLANAVGVALVGNLGAHSVTNERWAVRDSIDQATGMVVAQLRINPSDALAVLRAHAFAHATTLAEVSAKVLSRELGFTDDDSTDGNH
jgi:hypothetical protein